MQFRQIITAAAFSGLVLVSSVSQAATTFVSTASTTIGVFAGNLLSAFASEGAPVTSATAQSIYSGFTWSFQGESILGVNSANNVDVLISSFSPLASGGQVNLALFPTQLGQLDAALDAFLPAAIQFGQANSTLSLIQVAGLIPALNNSATLAFLGNSGNSLEITVSAIPEPGEWAMMLSGLAIVGAITRRRRKFAKS
jgi:hypothetical protein